MRLLSLILPHDNSFAVKSFSQGDFFFFLPSVKAGKERERRRGGGKEGSQDTIPHDLQLLLPLLLLLLLSSPASHVSPPAEATHPHPRLIYLQVKACTRKGREREMPARVVRLESPEGVSLQQTPYTRSPSPHILLSLVISHSLTSTRSHTHTLSRPTLQLAVGTRSTRFEERGHFVGRFWGARDTKHTGEKVIFHLDTKCPSLDVGLLFRTRVPSFVQEFFHLLLVPRVEGMTCEQAFLRLLVYRLRKKKEGRRTQLFLSTLISRCSKRGTGMRHSLRMMHGIR